MLIPDLSDPVLSLYSGSNAWAFIGMALSSCEQSICSYGSLILLCDNPLPDDK